MHELVEVLRRCKVIDGRAWVVDLTRLPTYSSVSKSYPDRPNGKSDLEAAFFLSAGRQAVTQTTMVDCNSAIVCCGSWTLRPSYLSPWSLVPAMLETVL